MKRYTAQKRSVKASNTENTYEVPEDKLHADYVKSFVYGSDVENSEYICFLNGMLKELSNMELADVFEFASQFFTTEQLHATLGPCMDKLGWNPGSAYTLQDFVQDAYGN